MTKKQMNERHKALDEFLSETYGDDVVHFDGLEFDGGVVFKQLPFTGGQKKKKKSKITR